MLNVLDFDHTDNALFELQVTDKEYLVSALSSARCAARLAVDASGQPIFTIVPFLSMLP